MFVTLVKGEDYTLGDVKFLKGVKTPVSEETFAYLDGNPQFELEAGEPKEVKLEDMKVAQLLEVALGLNIEGAKDMKKAELLAAVKAAQEVETPVETPTENPEE